MAEGHSNIDIKKVEKIICVKAELWYPSFNHAGFLSKEDLVQEGWATYSKIIKEGSYDKNKKTSFYTFLSYCINSDINNMFRVYLTSKKYVTVDPDSVDVCTSNSCSQERMLMLSDAISAMAEISSDFVMMITDEIPNDLFKKVKRRVRVLLHNRGFNTMNGKMRLKKEDIESFFNIDVENFKKILEEHI